MKKNHTKEKQRKNNIKRNIKNCILEKPFLTILAISLVILAILCLIFNFFMIIDMHECNELGLTSEYLSDEIRNSFFSLTIGYFNLVTAISIGIITLRLTMKNDRRNRLETLQNLKIKEILFYNQYENFTPSKLRYGDIYKRQFFIKIVFSNFNNTYSLNNIKVSWSKCAQTLESDDEKTLNKYKAYVEYSKQISLYIFFEDFETDDLKETINYFYHINEYSPELMRKHERYRWIRLHFELEEKIIFKSQKPKKLDIDYTILVKNKTLGKDYVGLVEVQHNIKIED